MKRALVDRLWHLSTAPRSSSPAFISPLQHQLKIVPPNDNSVDGKRLVEPYVKTGTDYEEICAQVLAGDRYRFQLARCGGSGDGGVDLEGQWLLGGSDNNLPVIAQCKRIHSTTRRLPVSTAREFAGTMNEWRARHSTGQRLIGLLISSNGFTKAAISHFQSSLHPGVMVWLETMQDSLRDQPEDIHPRDLASSGHVREWAPNQALQDLLNDRSETVAELVRVGGRVRRHEFPLLSGGR